ncbi:GntR family transcriptional regulator [Prosthecobacter sp.]|uniref:GntR family transcriptional regulator n=1 Tax=Prosthecobacter sp. TaxID=1965333 RepID=UPI001D241615|nr:GntR family transcriptional regulator [Prosthecobacter sp.]MCB1276262.1 GntR family transcriptional regulator [Prosthecobacter sp.]
MPARTLSKPSQKATAAALPSRLQSRAYAELRRLIASGEFPAGTFLSERQLAAQLEMSKTPVHVALERLESEGFVTISAQQGIVVRGLTVDDIVDHYELREAIESYAVGRVAGRLTEAQRASLEESLENQDAAIKRGDVAELIDLDARFHLLLATFHGNRQIIATMEQLRDKIHQVIVRVTSLNPQRLSESVEEHRGIAKAVLDGDSALAARLAVAHLDAGKRHILSPTRLRS